MLISDQEELIEKARSLCNVGRVRGGGWYEHVNLGTNQRLTGWQAAVLLMQLRRLPEQLQRRLENARFLDCRLRQFEFLELPEADSRITCHSHYLYMIRLRLERLAGTSRDAFIRALIAEGVPGAGGYPYPLYDNKVFEQHEYRCTDCPEAERMCRESFWVSHQVMLAEPVALEDFVSALTKVAENAAQLCGT